MTSREYFGVAVRVIGFWYLTGGIYETLAKVFPFASYSQQSAFATFSSGIIFALLGGLILALADNIVAFIYGAPPSRSPSKQ